MSRTDEIAELLRIALYDTDGETEEGAFVDYWVSNASRAHFGLETLFKETGFTPADEDQIRAALRQPGVPLEAAAGLVAALDNHLRSLVRELLKDPDPAIRAVGIRCAAGALPREEWLPALSDAEGEVRGAAVAGISYHYGSLPDANDDLIRALEDPDPRVVLGAVPRIRLTPGGSAADAIARRATRKPESQLTRPLLLELAHKVNSHYSSPGIDGRVGREALDTLMWALTYPDTEVRRDAVLALSCFRTEEMAKILFDRLQLETDKDVRWALSRFGGFFHLGEPAERFLVGLMLHDPDPYLRGQMAFQMEHFGPSVVEPLIEALKDAPITRAAAMSLGKVGDLRALAGLSDAFADPQHKISHREIGAAMAGITINAAHADPPIMPADMPERIQALLNAWVPSGWVQEVCQRLGGLPLHGNPVYIWGLRPDGEIFWMDHESASHENDLETDPLTRFAVMVQGARKKPALRDFIPRPTKEARPCGTCNATGVQEGRASGCMSCNGLGWVASDRYPY